MAFAVREFRDLIRVLETHPEWREELRRHVLTSELLALPQMVRDLATQVQAMAEFQRRQYEEFSAFRTEIMGFRAETERRFQELAEAERRTEERLVRVEGAIQSLTDAQRHLGAVVGQLQRTLGATIEEEAESVLMDVLEKKGYRLIGVPYDLFLDGEVDVVQAIKDQEGRRLWALAEV